uniref:SAM domain-containing protein n=1 Tax=Syphacia muris TaxID=451379 RepID=A0A0N5ADQ6_9BILA
MDVDESGDIDRTESTGFIGKNEMGGGSDRGKREMAFHHGNDDKVDVDELWESWFASNERSWTTSELVSWLENIVKLPQYADAVISNQLDGRALPRLALLNSTLLTETLGVKSYIDKKKIVIKALDLVLFGLAEDGTSRMKDVALTVLVIFLGTVVVILRKQQKRSCSKMEELTTKLAQLKTMENDFEEAQKKHVFYCILKFEEEKKKRQSLTEATVAENEKVETLRFQLMEAERLLESNNSAPLALQPLLQRTCELELSYIGQQRLECIAEMSEAVELIEKLRKKQSSIISSIKLATGASVGTDQVDSRIFSLKARMEKISLIMAECHRRWLEIESLCGFQVTQLGSNSGIF